MRSRVGLAELCDLSSRSLWLPLLRPGRLWSSLLLLRCRSRIALLALLWLLLEELEDQELVLTPLLLEELEDQELVLTPLLLLAGRGRLRLVFTSSS